MYESILYHLSRHVQLTPAQEQLLTSRLQLRRLRKKQYLLQEGEVCRQSTFVVKGCLRSYQIDEQGREHVLQFAFEGWWIGDTYSFLTGTPTRRTIDALEDTEVLQLAKDDLEELYHDIPQLERYYRISMQNAYVALQQRLLASVSKPAEERYQELLARFPGIEQRVAQQHLASYLGITPESLSRIRRQLAERS